MRVFLDTNIILDLLLERDGFQDSATIFQMQEDGKIRLCVSFLTMVNVAYVYKKIVGESMAIVNLKYLSSLLEVLPMDSNQLQQAIMLDGKDIEDTLQATCAQAAGCDYIITRNIKDYKITKGLSRQVSLPPVLSPASYISKFQNPDT